MHNVFSACMKLNNYHHYHHHSTINVSVATIVISDVNYFATISRESIIFCTVGKYVAYNGLSSV